MRCRLEFGSCDAARRCRPSLYLHVPKKVDPRGYRSAEARRRSPRQPLSLEHFVIEMVILPFFHNNFLISLYFFNNWRLHLRYYDYFDKFLRLQNLKLFSRRQDSLHSSHNNLDIVSKTVYKYCIDY